MSGKNSIQVAIKVRPPSRKEKDQQIFWRVVDNSIQLADSQSEPYYFDHIFDQNTNNQVIFDTMAKQIVQSAIKGLNGTIFAYGQTSSGKTYTMMGDESNPGVMVLAAKEIFKEIERTADRQFLLRVGYIEIYNEKIYDLLNKKNQDLKIHETSTGIISVNCEEIIIRSQDDLLTYLEKGGKERTVGETNMNERSSRSHAIFRIIVESRKMERTEDDAVIQSVINLVDLAGSERADQTGARGTRLKEGGHINKSLLFLSTVIKRLSENEDDKYISFRDSKLTRILQASLGGNALTTIICTIKPNAIEETQSTLNFALRAKAIKNKPEVNEIISDATMMKRLEHEIKVLKTRLEEEQRKNESQIKVRQLEQRIKDEDLKIISCNSIRNREKRRRTWCPSSTNLDASTVNQQISALPLPGTGSLLASGIPQPSRLQAPKTSYYNTPHITLRLPKESPQESQRSSVLPIPSDFPEVDEEFAPGESINFEMLSPKNTPRNATSTTSITPKLICCERSTLEKIENDFQELQSFTNWENKVQVESEPVLTLKHKVETLTQRNAELEKERCKFLLLQQEIEMMTENLTDCQGKMDSLMQRNAELEKESIEHIQLKTAIETVSESLADAENRCDKLQMELSKLTASNKTADEKMGKYEAELAELKKTNEKLEMENREAVNLEFEFKRHKNKSKLRENELLEAITDKDKEIKKLEKSINVLNSERLQNVKEELHQRSLNEDGKADENGKFDIKCEDLQRLLEENKKITLEFEKLTLEYEKSKINYVELENEHETNKVKIVYLEELKEKERVEHETLQQEHDQVKKQLLEIQKQFEDMQKEYEDLSNELMDNLQEIDHVKAENTKLIDKLKDYEDKNQQLPKEAAESKEHEWSSEKSNVLNTSSACHHNSSMRSDERVEMEDVHSTQSQELMNKFYEISESLTEIELETKKGNTKLFKTASKNSGIKSYKMYLKNILGVQKIQKEFDMENENTYLQGFFTHHSFHIMELSDEDYVSTTESNNIDINGCQNITEYIEKLKKDIKELKMINESINQDRLNNKSLLESTERALSEMKDQITQLSGELLEKSMFVEKCACKSYQQQIENLEKEKADIAIVYEELQEKINSTLNSSLLMNNSLPAAEVKSDLEDKLKEIEQLKLREQELSELYDSQTKILEEITQRCVDMEADLEMAREELKNQQNEFREKYNKLQLENLQKLELSANEYRDNMKKYNKEWEDSRDQYEQTIKDLQNQINVFKKEVAEGDIEIEINPEDISCTKQSENEIEKSNLDVTPESTTNKKFTLVAEDLVVETYKDKCGFEEQKRSQEQELNEAEELLVSMKANNHSQYEEITVLNTKIIHLEELLADAKRLNETINEENSSLKFEINSIKEDHNCIPDLRIRNQQLSDEIERLQQEYSQLEDKLRKTETEIQKTKISHLQAMEEEKNNLANEFYNLKEQYNQVQDKLQKAEQQIQEFCIEDSRREELMQKLQTKLDNMTAEEDERKTVEIQELRASLSCLQEKEMENSKEIQDFKQKVEMLLQKVSDLENAESRLYLEKSDLEEKLKQTTNELNLLNRDKLLLESQLDTLTEERKSLLETLSILQEEKITLEEQLKEMKAEVENNLPCITETVEKTNNQLDENEKLMSSLKENIEDRNRQLKETEREKEKILQDNANLYRDLETVKQELNEMKEMKAEVENNLRCITETLEKTKNQLDENEKLMLSLKENIEDRNRQLKETEREKEKILQDNANLYRDLETVKQELNEMKEMKAEVENNLRCITETLEKTKNQLDENEKLMLSLKENIEDRNRQLKETEREKEKILQDNANLYRDLETVKQELNEMKEMKAEVENNLRCITETLEKTKNQLDEKEKLMLSLKENIEDRNRQLKETEREKEKILQDNANLYRDLETVKQELNEMKEMKAEVENNLRCITETLEKTKNQLDENEKLMQHDREEKAEIQQNMLSLKENIEDRNRQLKETKREKEKIQQDNANLYRDLETLKQDFINASEEKEKHFQKLDECHKNNIQLKKDLTKQQQEKQEQLLVLDKIVQERKNLERDFQKLQELPSKLKKEQEENQELEQQLKHLNAALAICKEDQHRTIDTNSCLQTELQATKESLSKLQQDHINLQEKLTHYEKLQEDKNKLEATLNVLKKAQNGALTSLQEEKDKLLKTLQRYEEENNEYKEKEETLQQKIKPLYQQMHEMRCKVQSYEKFLLEHKEVENIITSMTAENEKFQQEISELSSQKDVYISQIENLTSQIEKLNALLKNQTDEKQLVQSKFLLLTETLQSDQLSLQKELEDLKSTLEELQLKCNSLQLSNTQLENLNKQLEQQNNSTKEKLKEFESMQEELKTVKTQHSKLQQSLKKTFEETERCSLALREDVERHKQLLHKQTENYNSMKVEMESKQHSLNKENNQLSAIIEELKKEKLLLEKNLRDLTVRNFEFDLQRHAMDATANSSLDSNVSCSPKGRLSLERKSADKGYNTSSEEKFSVIQQKNIAAERKNRRLSTHDERRRQSYWGAVYDKATMTDSLDTSCSCAELDRKLKECERDLFIKNSQVTALNMELKNHPLKEENATLKKRLQEEQDKHRIEIKRCKNKLYEQTVKAEKAIAKAAHVTAKSAYDATTAALAAEQQAKPVLPVVLCDVETQTDDDLSSCIHKLEGKYKDLKHICRYRYNVIKDLEEKVAQKENSEGNSLPPLDASHMKIMKKQYEALQLELNTIKEKYENAKKLLNCRRDEIQKLRAQLDQNQ